MGARVTFACSDAICFSGLSNKQNCIINNLFYLGGLGNLPAQLDVIMALALVDRDEGGRDAVLAQTPLVSLFMRQDFLP